MKNLVSNKPIVAAVVISCLLILGACEFDPQAKLEGGNPPVFSVWSGTGNLLFISIREYRPDKSLKPSERSVQLWRVEAIRDDTGQLLGRRASDVDRVTYGVVPEGYRQVIPASGNPPPLIEGSYYSYDFQTAAGMPADGDFEIRGSQAVSVKRAHDCYYIKDGKEIETACGDSNDNANR